MEISKLKEIFKKSLREIFFDDSCSVCKGKLDRDSFICTNCLKELLKLSFIKKNGNFYFLFYYETGIRNIISDYKIRNRKELARDLAYIIQKTLEQLLIRENIDVVIPVPISKNRQKERGFNQIENLLEILDIKYKKIHRIKDTKHMYALKDCKAREKNVADVFKNYEDLSGKNILLIDDIVTTGATIKSIIKEIEKNAENINIKVFSIAMSRRFTIEDGE